MEVREVGDYISTTMAGTMIEGRLSYSKDNGDSILRKIISPAE